MSLIYFTNYKSERSIEDLKWRVYQLMKDSVGGSPPVTGLKCFKELKISGLYKTTF